MPAAEIFRPVCTANFTILPNELFNLLDYYPNLKTRDPMVLIHLFSKFDYATTGRSWYMNYRTIARELKMGVWSVRQALKRLREAGIASYRRFSNGTTLWTIRLPERFGAPCATTPAEVVVMVQEAKEAVIPASDTHTMAITQAVEAVVVTEEAKKLPIPICFTDSEARIIQRELEKLPNDELKTAVLAQAEQAILAKQARNPLKYLLGLVNIAMKGEFDMPPLPENIEAKTKPRKRNASGG